MPSKTQLILLNTLFQFQNEEYVMVYSDKYKFQSLTSYTFYRTTYVTGELLTITSH